MPTIYEEVIGVPASCDPIIQNLGDSESDKIAVLILGDSDTSKDCFDKSKMLVEKLYSKKVILLWLKTLSLLPESLKLKYKFDDDTIVVGLTKARNISYVLTKKDKRTEPRIQQLILKTSKKSKTEESVL